MHHCFIRHNKFLVLVIISLQTIFYFPKDCKAQNADNFHSVLLLIDASGSMNGVKMDSVKSAAKQIISMLLPCNTEFAVMGFTGDKKNPVPYHLDFTLNKPDLFEFIDKLKPWGGTLIGAALEIGNQYFCDHIKSSKSIKQTIILLSDGRSDDDVAVALKELNAKKMLIQTECIGYDLLKDKLAEDQLKKIAFETKGEYYSATDVSNVAKAFIKSSIKTIINDVPVVVRNKNNDFSFKPITLDAYKLLTTQNWFLDSIQINVSDELYGLAMMVTNENMQDTLPKSLIFDNSKTISLYIDNKNGRETNKKWIDGNFTFNKNALTITISQYYFKLIVKAISKNSLVLCVNKFQFLSEGDAEPLEEVCNCNNKMNIGNPYIFVYFSKAGCD
jgi:uncharacterized protein YegL